MTRRILTIIALVAASVALTASPSASQVINVVVTPATAQPGDALTVTGEGCDPDALGGSGHEIIVTLVEVATGVAFDSTLGVPDPGGSWTLPLTVPTNAPGGGYEARTVCRYMSGGISVGAAGEAGVVTVDRPASAPSMTISPMSGVLPLTVTVSGSECTGPAGEDITVQVNVLNASLNVIESVTVPVTTALPWSTTLTLTDTFPYQHTVQATCLSPSLGIIQTYPDQRFEVVLPPGVVSASTDTAAPGEEITVTADRCPDFEGPVLGGDYRVAFTMNPGGIEVFGAGDFFSGVSSATFTIPDGAADGDVFTISAVCEFSELSPFFELFTYENTVAVTVAGAPTPTPTATVAPSATPAPTATVAPSATSAPTATAAPTATPLPPTSTPTATPAPAATAEPVPTSDTDATGAGAGGSSENGAIGIGFTG